MAISNNSTGLRPGVCTSTTRPTAPYEGQMIYETDTDMVAIWNGSAWRYISATTPTNGTVLQVVTATTASPTQSTSATHADTTLTVTITPKSTTSKIFVMTNQSVYNSGAANSTSVRLVRGSTTLQLQTDTVYSTATDIVGNCSFMFLDSPATTSATIYKTTFARTSGTGISYVQINTNPSNITVMEISG